MCALCVSGLTEEDGQKLSHLLRETDRAFKEGFKMLAECAKPRQPSVDRLGESVGHLGVSIGHRGASLDTLSTNMSAA